MKKKAYVIGNSVAQSLSPNIFNYWFKKYNINAEYLYKQIKPENFDNEINEILSEPGVCGFNVTIPFKEIIKNKLDNIDKHSEEIGAINCVSKNKNRWCGKNTDWIGFSKLINNRDINLKKNTAIVIGYGGVAKAIVYALKKEGFKEIKIFNRTLNKIKHLNKKADLVTLDLSLLSNHLDSANLIVNTTPIDTMNSILLPKNMKNFFACDMVYKPKETSFLSHFSKNKRIYGIHMLVYQAAPCFKEWFGVQPLINQELLSYLDGCLN